MRLSERGQMLHQLVLDLVRNCIGLRHRCFLIDRYVEFRCQPMSEPARPDQENTIDLWDMLGCMTDLIDHLRLDTVEQAREYGFARLPDDAEDRDCDQQADQRISDRKAKPHANGSHDNGEA